MRRLGIAMLILSALCVVAAICLAVTAIWTVGPDAGRYGGTAFLALVTSGFLGVAGGTLVDIHRD